MCHYQHFLHIYQPPRRPGIPENCKTHWSPHVVSGRKTPKRGKAKNTWKKLCTSGNINFSNHQHSPTIKPHSRTHQWEILNVQKYKYLSLTYTNFQSFPTYEFMTFQPSVLFHDHDHHSRLYRKKFIFWRAIHLIQAHHQAAGISAGVWRALHSCAWRSKGMTSIRFL